MEAWLYLLDFNIAASFLHYCHINGRRYILYTIEWCCRQNFTLLSQKCKESGFTYRRLVLQPVFYNIVTKIKGAEGYVLQDYVAGRILHFCHKNGRSRVLPTRGLCCSKFFILLSQKWKGLDTMYIICIFNFQYVSNYATNILLSLPHIIQDRCWDLKSVGAKFNLYP